jgi:hypothetical protein
VYPGRADDLRSDRFIDFELGQACHRFGPDEGDVMILLGHA